MTGVCLQRGGTPGPWSLVTSPFPCPRLQTEAGQGYLPPPPCRSWEDKPRTLYRAGSTLLRSRRRTVLFKNELGNHFYRPRTNVRREVMFSQVCVCSRGGGRPDPAFSLGRVPIQIWMGGVPIQPWTGGGPNPALDGGGSQSSLGRGRGYPVSVKGKFFDSRFGLIHVQTGTKNFFCRGTPLGGLLGPRAVRVSGTAETECALGKPSV